jgi:hypothetical protein
LARLHLAGVRLAGVRLTGLRLKRVRLARLLTLVRLAGLAGVLLGRVLLGVTGLSVMCSIRSFGRRHARLMSLLGAAGWGRALSGWVLPPARWVDH